MLESEAARLRGYGAEVNDEARGGKPADIRAGHGAWRKKPLTNQLFQCSCGILGGAKEFPGASERKSQQSGGQLADNFKSLPVSSICFLSCINFGEI
jgi:hypothetical protein